MEIKQNFGLYELPQRSVSIKARGGITLRELKVNSVRTRAVHTMLCSGTGPG